MYEKKIFKLSEKENKRVLTILNKIKERYNYTNSDMAKKIDMDYNAFYRMMKGQQLVMQHYVDKFKKAFPDWDNIYSSKKIVRDKTCPLCKEEGAVNVRKGQFTKGVFAKWIRNERKKKCMECGYQWMSYEIDDTSLEEILVKIGEENALY
jgi:hypothetical protein|tara:strand:+ start:3638 stop:4090 length:453 start_codon:yes stop_codon:yes gene_type:complete